MDKKKENKRPFKLILLIAGIAIVLLLTFGGLTIYFLIRNGNKEAEITTRPNEISTSTLNVPLTSIAIQSRSTTRTFFRPSTTTELNDDDDLEDYIIVRWTTTTKATTSTTTIEDTDQREIELNDEDLENFLDELNSSTTMSTSTTTTTSNNINTFIPNSFFYGTRIHSNFSNATGCDDCTFGPIKTETNFIFQNRSFDSFNISANGYVIFKKDSYTLVIRPFFSDIDMRNKGFINHGEIQVAEKIEEIGSEISSLCKYDNYMPSWAYLVTWYECAAYSQYSYLSNYVNTFQLLLTSNGNESFAMFNFIRMDWPSASNYKAFSSGYDLNYYSIFSMRFTPELEVSIENKSVQNLIEKSNMGKTGRWFISFNNTRCRF